ncbi:hypothetical protein Pcinc_035347 [Petrolisthes cinctipes]|uniref:Uncharacterized protein n=1 Tax=Petrolisthes cinctipes TaxID=88211 RepID=A0AAE1BXZ7_PETCI|nr:hypothetical protein Pcinc_035347 [Petrolisthes cinctipes]
MCSNSDNGVSWLAAPHPQSGVGVDVTSLQCVSLNWDYFFCNWTVPDCQGCVAVPYLYTSTTTTDYVSGECSCDDNPPPSSYGYQCSCPNDCCIWGPVSYPGIDPIVTVGFHVWRVYNVTQHHSSLGTQNNNNPQHSSLGTQNNNNNPQHSHLDTHNNYNSPQHLHLGTHNINPQHSSLGTQNNNNNPQHSHLDTHNNNNNSPQHSHLDTHNNNNTYNSPQHSHLDTHNNKKPTTLVFKSTPGALGAHNHTFNNYELATRLVNVTWTLPAPMSTFSQVAGVVIRVDYRLATELTTSSLTLPWSMGDLIRCKRPPGGCLHGYQVVKLGLWYEMYEVRVRLRSGEAPSLSGEEEEEMEEEDGWWSDWVPVYYITPAVAPEVGPAVCGGGYMTTPSSSDSQRRDVILNWRSVPVFLHNGPGFDYLAVATPVAAEYGWHEGVKETEEERDLNYTVFMCIDDLYSPDPCKGAFYWVNVGNVTSLNLTLGDFINTAEGGTTRAGGRQTAVMEESAEGREAEGSLASWVIGLLTTICIVVAVTTILGLLYGREYVI